jgi:hypothetical protein
MVFFNPSPDCIIIAPSPDGMQKDDALAAFPGVNPDEHKRKTQPIHGEEGALFWYWKRRWGTPKQKAFPKPTQPLE